MLLKLCHNFTRNLFNAARSSVQTQGYAASNNQHKALTSLHAPFTCSILSRTMATLKYIHRRGPVIRKRKNPSAALEGHAFKKAIVLKTIIKKPKKPNSANRKCARVRLSNGKEVTVYIPGEGHTLQEHSIILVGGGRLQDVPGVKLTAVRGKYDLPHVQKKT